MIEDLAGEFTDVDDFEEFIAKAREWVEKIFAGFDEADDDLAAAAVFQDAAGSVAFCPLAHFMQSEESKNALSEILPKVAQMSNACRYLFASSAWAVITASKDELEEWYSTHDSLEHHPDCKEIVQLFIGEWTGDIASLTAHIIRHEGAPPTLDEWQEIRNNWLSSEIGGHCGRFADPVMFQLTGMRAMALTAVDNLIADSDIRDKFWGVVTDIAKEKGYDNPDDLEFPDPLSEEGQALFAQVSEKMEERYPDEMEKIRNTFQETLLRRRQGEET